MELYTTSSYNETMSGETMSSISEKSCISNGVANGHAAAAANAAASAALANGVNMVGHQSPHHIAYMVRGKVIEGGKCDI